jgi:hypothetical protein
MKGVDAATFEVLSRSWYARDQKHVYYPLNEICYDTDVCGVCTCNTYEIQGADPKSFRYMGLDYATDGVHVYFRGRLIERAEGKSVRLLWIPGDLPAIADDKTVYIHEEAVKDANPAQFACPRHPNDMTWYCNDGARQWKYVAPEGIRLLKNTR